MARGRERHLWGAPLGVHGQDTADATRMAASTRLGSSRTVGGLLVLTAGVLTAVGAVMPWATISAFRLAPIAVRGTDADQYGGTTLVLGVLSAVLGAVLIGRVGTGWEWIIAAVAGMMIVLMAIVDLLQLLRGIRLDGIDLGFSIDIGPGLWLTLLGGCAVVGGSLFARFGPRRTRPPFGGPAS